MWFFDAIEKVYNPDYESLVKWIEDKYDDYYKLESKKKILCERLKGENEYIYNYFVNKLYLYKSEKILNNNKINILELFMTSPFYNLIISLNTLFELEELFNILHTKEIKIKYENLDEIQFVNALDISIYTDVPKKHKCPCGQTNCMELMIFKNVKDNKDLIIGNDCIKRIKTLFYLMKNEELSKKTTNILMEQEKDLKKLKEKIKKEEEKIKKEEEMKEINEWLNLPENIYKTECIYPKSTCINKNNYKKRYTQYVSCFECNELEKKKKHPSKKPKTKKKINTNFVF